MIVWFELAREFTEIISGGKRGLVGSLGEDDGVRVEVQHLLGLKLTQSVLVKFKVCPTGGEAGHKDVNVDLDRVGLVNVIVHDLYHFVVDDAQSLEVLCVVVQQVVQMERR